MTASPDLAIEILQHLRRFEANGSPGFAAQVLEVFLRDAAIRLACLRDATASRDGGTVRRVAHTLQGSAAMVGSPQVARQCAELAEAARAGEFAECEVILTALEANFQAIHRAVRLSYD